MKSREQIIAISLITLCSLSLIIGLFTLKKKATEASKKDASELVGSFMKDKVAVVGIEGMILDSFETWSPFARNVDSASAKKELREILEDDNVKGVLLRLNSPGGTVGASQELYQVIEELKAAGKPIVASMGDVCASGCYYLASAADKIIANPGTLTGSIGVIAQGFNLTGLLFKIGVQDRTFKSGKYKDLGSPMRNMTLEEQQIMQALLDDSYDQFLNDVAKARGVERDALDPKAQGLIYTGRQALEAQLVDKLGTYEDSKELMRELLEESGYKKAKAIQFVETWRVEKLGALDNFLGFGFSEKLSLSALLGKFIPSISSPSVDLGSTLDRARLSMSEYQPLWLMP